MTEKKKSGYLRSVRSELKKVHWPTKKEIVQYTVTTIVIAAIIALVSWGLDIVFNWLVSIVS